MRRSLLALLLLALVPSAPASARYATGGLGYWSDGSRTRVDAACLNLPEVDRPACRVAAFKGKPFVVIAVVDTGINPYHRDFRAPEFTVHPSEFIAGYPAETPSIDLSFDAPTYEDARAADFAKFLVPAYELRWFPGTRIIGGIRATGGSVLTDPPILDDNGHGTGSAGVAAGQTHGSAPEALIVAIEGLGDGGLRWARSQPWIDVVTNSWGPQANIPSGDPKISRDLVRDGKSVLFAAGNGASNTGIPDSNPTITSPYAGAPEVITVGAVTPSSGQATWWHSIPPDVSSFGTDWPTANSRSFDGESGFGGTSCATPVTAGVVASSILRARELLGDTTEGVHDGALAIGPALASGPLRDGRFTNDEAEDAVLKTAFPAPFDTDQASTGIRPTTPAYFVYEGYGVVDRDSKARAAAVIAGDAPMPDRSDVDAWFLALDAARGAIWTRP